MIHIVTYRCHIHFPPYDPVVIPGFHFQTDENLKTLEVHVQRGRRFNSPTHSKHVKHQMFIVPQGLCFCMFLYVFVDSFFIQHFVMQNSTN